MLTQKSTSGEIQKSTLKTIMKQNSKFTEQEILDEVVELFEDEYDYQFVSKIVSKTIDYCRREIHLIDINDGICEINHERKQLVGSFLDHEGVTI